MHAEHGRPNGEARRTRRNFLTRAGGAAALTGLAVVGLSSNPLETGDAALAAGTGTSPKGLLEQADAVFAQGHFTLADSLYRLILLHDPTNVHARVQHAHFQMLTNRLRSAREHLKRALRLEATHQKALRHLADTLWRMDRFTELAGLLPSVPEGLGATVEQLRSFAGGTPYRIHGPSSTSARLLSLDPLPMVEVSVNGNEPVVCFLDTGGMLSIFDDYASRVGVPTYGWTTGRSVAGEFKMHHGRLDSLQIGKIRIEHLPVSTLPRSNGIGGGMQAPDGRTVDGVVGTSVLSHFVSTIDYRGMQLALRRKGTGGRRHRTSPVGWSEVSTPLWFHGDHYLHAHGSLNGVGPQVFFVDTGGSGTGFTASDDTYREAGIAVPPGDGVRDLTVERLALGSAVRRDVPARAGVLPDEFWTAFGFKVGGLITHEFFREFSLTFDFERMRIVLARP